MYLHFSSEMNFYWMNFFSFLQKKENTGTYILWEGKNLNIAIRVYTCPKGSCFWDTYGQWYTLFPQFFFLKPLLNATGWNFTNYILALIIWKANLDNPLKRYDIHTFLQSTGQGKYHRLNFGRFNKCQRTVWTSPNFPTLLLSKGTWFEGWLPMFITN